MVYGFKHICYFGEGRASFYFSDNWIQNCALNMLRGKPECMEDNYSELTRGRGIQKSMGIIDLLLWKQDGDVRHFCLEY